MRLVLRTDEKDYLLFRKHTSACNSPVGRHGGRQEILCDLSSFSAGSIVHEICHFMGIHHEHQRADRVCRITLSSVLSVDASYRIQESHSAAAPSDYDFGSIMHYEPGTRNRNFSVDVNLFPGMLVGQRSRLSSGDIQGLNWLRRDFIQEFWTTERNICLL